MTETKYLDFLKDRISLIIEKLNALPQDNAYDVGKAMAYYDVLNTMKSQAERFEIPLADIGLDNVCLEDLIKSK